MDKRSKDELILIALHLDVLDILNLCKTNKVINEKVCKNSDLWRRLILRDFPNFNFESLNAELKKLFPKDIYTLLYTIKVWTLNIDVNMLFETKKIYAELRNIKVIPENLYLPNLKTLILDHNRIKRIPDTLRLPNLERLSLNRNFIRDLPNLNLPNLTELSLADNYIQRIPDNLILPPKLKLLDLRGTYPFVPRNFPLKQSRIMSLFEK